MMDSTKINKLRIRKMVRIEVSNQSFEITKNTKKNDDKTNLLLAQQGGNSVELALENKGDLNLENCFDADKADALLTAIRGADQSKQLNELFSAQEESSKATESSVSVGSYFTSGGQYDIVFHPKGPGGESKSEIKVSDTAKRLTPQNVALGFGALFGAASLTMTLGTAYSCNFLLTCIKCNNI